MIIGVPTGVGLSILLIGTCVVWLACSSYLEHRRAMAEHYGGTRTTNLVRSLTCFPLPLPPSVSSLSPFLPSVVFRVGIGRNARGGSGHSGTLSLMTEYVHVVSEV